MKSRSTALLAIVLGLACLVPLPARALDPYTQVDSPDSLESTAEETDSPPSSPHDPGYGPHLQVGAFYRFAHSVEDDKVYHLLTADLSVASWSRLHSTWGGGVHVAIDDFGHRVGVKGIWRKPLSKRGSMYLQLAPGVYVSSVDESFTPKLPGYFLELEVGLLREFALVLATEVLPYENRRIIYYSPPPPNAPHIEASGTSTAFFVGAKAGQLGAIAAVAVAGLVVLLGTIENPWGPGI